MFRNRSPARHRAAPAVRNGLAAAALTSGALTVAVLAPAAVPMEDAAALALTSGSATGVLRIASVVPVRDVAPVPAGFTVSAVLKSAGLVDVARRAEERESAARCDAGLDGLGRVSPWVRDAARFLSCRYGEPDLIGVAGRARHSDHPGGLAVDFMMRGERGDRLAACALANRAALGVSYVIWEQRINFGEGWQRMEDRGGATENHLDHVHVSFEPAAGDGAPLAGRCS